MMTPYILFDKQCEEGDAVFMRFSGKNVLGYRLRPRWCGGGMSVITSCMVSWSFWRRLLCPDEVAKPVVFQQ